MFNNSLHIHTATGICENENLIFRGPNILLYWKKKAQYFRI